MEEVDDEEVVLLADRHLIFVRSHRGDDIIFPVPAAGGL